MRFDDGVPVVVVASEVRVGERHAPEWRPSKHVRRRRLAVLAEEESRLRAQIRVTPSVQDDSRDVTLRIETRLRKHVRKLFTNPAFILAERNGVQLCATAHRLGRDRLAGI